MHDSYVIGFDLLKDVFNIKFMCTLDSDTIHKENWLITLKNVYENNYKQVKGLLLTGFNTHAHKIIKEHDNFYEKESIGGISMFFETRLYNEYIRNKFIHNKNEWDWEVVHETNRRDYKIYCTKPSVIQHIGRFGMNVSHDHAFDF